MRPETLQKLNDLRVAYEQRQQQQAQSIQEEVGGQSWLERQSSSHSNEGEQDSPLQLPQSSGVNTNTTTNHSPPAHTDQYESGQSNAAAQHRKNKNTHRNIYKKWKKYDFRDSVAALLQEDSSLQNTKAYHAFIRDIQQRRAEPSSSSSTSSLCGATSFEEMEEEKKDERVQPIIFTAKQNSRPIKTRPQHEEQTLSFLDKEEPEDNCDDLNEKEERVAGKRIPTLFNTSTFAGKRRRLRNKVESENDEDDFTHALQTDK